MMLDDVEEFLKKIKEFRESEEFKKTKEILDLIDTVDETMKRYYDLINPKPKITTSDNTEDSEHVKLPEGFGEYGYADGQFIDYYHKHAWVEKNSHTGGTDYQCATCGAWKTVNWSNDKDNYSFDMEYFYNDKVLGC